MNGVRAPHEVARLLRQSANLFEPQVEWETRSRFTVTSKICVTSTSVTQRGQYAPLIVQRLGDIKRLEAKLISTWLSVFGSCLGRQGTNVPCTFTKHRSDEFDDLK